MCQWLPKRIKTISPEETVSSINILRRDPTLADAILDRLVHNAHRIELQGESQRKIRAQRTMSST